MVIDCNVKYSVCMNLLSTNANYLYIGTYYVLLSEIPGIHMHQRLYEKPSGPLLGLIVMSY
jgi:hypothetical protein